MSQIDKFTAAVEESRLRLQTIVRLRWFGVGGQLLAVLGVRWGLGFEFALGACLALIAISAWVNVFLRLRYPARFRLNSSTAAFLLAYDITGLAALLYLTGGIENPFAYLIVAPVTVSAATLPMRNTVMLAVLALAAALLLVEAHLPLPWSQVGGFSLPRTYKLGILASITSGMIFIALYAARLSKEARQMSAALAATEHILAREQRLHALDGLAAAAAHELGTPLATITLVTKEMEAEKDRYPEIADDISLLRSQAERCREILRTLARRPSEQDPHHVSLPVTQLLQEAAAPYEMLAHSIVISSKPTAHALASQEREPIGERRPGVIYGIGNLIENAADFANAQVEVTAVWDERDVVVTIADDGPGFAPEIMETLGEPYVTTRGQDQRGDHSARQAAGLGLGVFIAKTLLERSGARLSFANREGSMTGAVVRVTWSRQLFDLADPKAARTVS